LQRGSHPDRHSNATDGERLLSMQMTAKINEGFHTLKDVLARASYLLELQDIDTRNDHNTRMDPMFLMEQMDLREELSTARDAKDPFAILEKIKALTALRIRELTEEYKDAYHQGDFKKAYETVRKMQFLYKLRQEAEEISSDLEDDLL
jgi:molecular chaperone HscB